MMDFVRQPDGEHEVAIFRARLLSIYEKLDAEITALAPRCELSGRCCRFRDHGHTLFLSYPEAALLLADAGPTSRPLDDGVTCPWQDLSGRCTARNARPLGCRVYFCDPMHERRAPEITERWLAALKQMVEELALPWKYAPLHVHLRDAEESGRFPRTIDPLAR